MKPQEEILVGLSANPEMSFVVVEGAGEKAQLKSLSFGLAGGAVNVATAIKNLGHDPLLVAPIGIKRSDEGLLLEEALFKSQVRQMRLRVLEEVPIAVAPLSEEQSHSRVIGKKGVLTKDPSTIEQARQQIVERGGTWRFAMGIDQELVPLALHLLDGKHGFRVLGPHHTLRPLPQALLTSCDLLVLNAVEFRTLGRTVESIHAAGVSILLVTDAEHGGHFSLRNQMTVGINYGHFRAAGSPSGLYPVGAGDWFLGGFCVHIMENMGDAKSFANVSYDLVQSACNFGAKVAGLKIAMQGGSNGPTRAEVEQNCVVK